MVTLAESTLVLAKIRAHHGNAPITDLEARTFHEELRADANLADAMESVRRFYANNETGRWMLSGDVNAGIRRIQGPRIPDAVRIHELMEQDGIGISSPQSIPYRRTLIAQTRQGAPIEEARVKAMKAAQLVIEPPKPEPKPRLTGHFIGGGVERLGAEDLSSMIGGTK